jgi:hypothetical protein
MLLEERSWAIVEDHRKDREEPTIAPGANTHDPLEEKATEEEIERGEFTEVTRLYVDRTPED